VNAGVTVTVLPSVPEKVAVTDVVVERVCEVPVREHEVAVLRQDTMLAPAVAPVVRTKAFVLVIAVPSAAVRVSVFADKKAPVKEVGELVAVRALVVAEVTGKE